MNKKNKWILLSGLLFGYFFLNSCGSHDKNNNSGLAKIRLEIKQDPNAFPPAQLMTGEPASSAVFDCYGVNVMGEGIPSSDIGKPIDWGGISRGISCSSYPGIFSNPVSSNGGVMEASVPTGPSRIVQVIGFKSLNGTGCERIPEICRGNNSGSSSTDPCKIAFPYIYELGRSVTDIFGDMNLSIADAYTSAPDKSRKEVACDYGMAGGSGYYFTPITTSCNSPVSTPATATFVFRLMYGGQPYPVSSDLTVTATAEEYIATSYSTVASCPSGGTLTILNTYSDTTSTSCTSAINQTASKIRINLSTVVNSQTVTGSFEINCTHP